MRCVLFSSTLLLMWIIAFSNIHITVNLNRMNATILMWQTTNLFSTLWIGVHESLCWVCTTKCLGLHEFKSCHLKSALLPVCFLCRYVESQGDFELSVLYNGTLNTWWFGGLASMWLRDWNNAVQVSPLICFFLNCFWNLLVNMTVPLHRVLN